MTAGHFNLVKPGEPRLRPAGVGGSQDGDWVGSLEGTLITSLEGTVPGEPPSQRWGGGPVLLLLSVRT